MTVSATSPTSSFANLSGISTGTASSSTNAASNTGVAIGGSSPLSVSGLVSGINSTAIINALVAANAASTDVIQAQEQNDQTQLNALGGFNTLMLTAQLDLTALQQPSTFQNWQATSNNTTALTAQSAGGSAVPGTYSLNVLQVAQANQIATTGQTSQTASLGDGSVELQLGSGQITTLNFSTGGSLNDIATAINNANTGIIASVIDNGSSTPYQLVLQSSTTGAANTVLATGTGGLSSVFSGMTTLTNAEDAKVSIGGNGSGTSSITLQQASNTFTNLIPGISVTAQSLANNISVTVAANPAPADTAITKFVTDFNAAIKFFNTESAYNSSTQSGGPLISYSDLRSNLESLTEAFTGAVPGLPESLNNLNQLGITINGDDGTLAIDDTTLQAALSANSNGVMNMFTNGIVSSSPEVQYANLTSATNVSQPFTVNITTAAKQATVAPVSALAASGTVINSGNNSLNVNINGTALAITLTNGTYTASHLASALQTAINSQVSDPGDDVAVSLTGNQLNLQSTFYGSNQTIQILSSSSVASTLGLATTAATGVDVAGTIDGVAATGNGQLLSGADNTAAAGLVLNVTATAPLSGVSVTAREGLTNQLNTLFTQVNDASSGTLATSEDALSTTITGLGAQITQQQTLLQQERTNFQNQFAEMETLISGYKNQGNFLTEQIDGWDGSSSSSS